MYITNIKIRNFRNIENLELNLDKNINIFIGNNAQGKTNILESIYVLALTKSERSIADLDLIKKDQEFAKLRINLIKNKIKEQNLEVILQKSSKILKINNNIEKKVSNYISNLNVIMFYPNDLDIIKKSPNVRRNLLNIELCQLYPYYTKILNEYNKILKIRNEYLRKNSFNINHSYLDILTEKLIDRSLIITKYREDFINMINNNINSIYYKIMQQENLNIKYEKNVNIKEKEDLIKFYKENIDNEINQKITLYGPHRDDFIFMLNDENLKNYGSQGQQRVAILALKLSEIAIFKEVTQEYPIVLLDDIFSELDVRKRNNLIKFIKSNIQFIITTTDLNDINKKIIEKATIFKIKNGNITK